MTKMPDKNQDKDQSSGNRQPGGEGDAGLQEELKREASEGGDSVGDVGSNRNLSGSSTWQTLPDAETPPKDKS
jgi:hypothetical protein